MIEERKNADLFAIEADAIVNTVNCKGVMGKGIALEFKKRYPKSYEVYRAACDKGQLHPGIVLYVPGQRGERTILHFPTKDDWRKPSQLQWIRDGLQYLKEHYREWNLKRIAMPQLGCGLGGLDWRDVGPLVREILGQEDLDVIVVTRAVREYEPKGKPTPRPMPTWPEPSRAESPVQMELGLHEPQPQKEKRSDLRIKPKQRRWLAALVAGRAWRRKRSG